MLEIKNLSIKLNDRYLVENLSLVLNKNDKLAIIGEEGNGKSTLLKAILGIANYVNITKREIAEYYHMMGCYKIDTSKYDIQLLDETNYTEQIFSNGNDNLIINISPIDNGENYSKDKIISTFNSKTNHEFIYNQIK